MNSKERVRAAFTRQTLPDRIPLQFDLSRGLLDTFATRTGIPARITTAYYEDVTWRISANALRTAMGSDCVIVGASLPRGYQHPTDQRGLIVNEFGMGMRMGELYMEVIEYPLADVSSVREVEDFPFPNPLADGRYDDAIEDIARFRDSHFLIGDIEVTVFSMMHQLVGMEKLLMDMATGEPYVEALLERTENFAIAVGHKLISLGVEAIWGGDDFGTQKGLLMSPAMWRRYFKPSFQRLYGAMKAANPAILNLQHCDGAVAPLLSEWIDAGMEVFNPDQPNVPGHEPRELKCRFGDRLSFWGAIDQQYLLPNGTPEEIEADVRAKMETLGRGGGYMISPAHIIQDDVPPANVVAFIQAALKYGHYNQDGIPGALQAAGWCS